MRTAGTTLTIKLVLVALVTVTAIMHARDARRAQVGRVRVMIGRATLLLSVAVVIVAVAMVRGC